MNASNGIFASRFAPPLLAAGLLLTGCAGIAPRPSPADEAALRDLETIRPALQTSEDSLVLDLLIGYRTLAAGGSDADALRRAHAARTRIEHMLRNGGVTGHGREGRTVTVDGQRLTLIEAVEQVSGALLRNTPGTAWRPESDRAREIRRHRGSLAFLVEDAEWVLTLAAALEGPLPEDDKRRLRAVHESYAAGAPHAETAAQVNTLLGDLEDERLRRELKKLANRSWERERRDAADSATAPVPSPQPPVSDTAGDTASAGGDTSVAEPGPRHPAPVPLPNPADSGAGLLTPPGEPLVTPPESYCEDRRADAAHSFASARAAGDDAERTRYLQRSLELLDDCLQRHPDTEAAQKARRNREMVQRELEAQ